MSAQSPDQHKIALQAEARRRRLLYSLNDLQHALSACEFLYECEEKNTYSKIELRRFDAMKRRSSSRTRGRSPSLGAPLTMKMVGLKLSNDRQALHDRLVDMRNKIMAHSDSEMMRVTTQPFDVSMQAGEPPIYLIHTVFDEGVTLRGTVLIETNILLREVYQAVYGILTTPDEIETWMTATPDEALKLQRSLPDGALRIVARGVKEGSARPVT
jgi:hypothetical protein